MKSIGIKLADGSFYPILDDKGSKILELTTVKDNQDIVQIDLYRSESGTMEDAEYVDTLEIKNFPAKAQGEPTMNLSISLDENDVLNAKVEDVDSGKSSGTTVQLVSRPTSINDTPDYKIKDTKDFSLPTVEDLDKIPESLPPVQEATEEKPQENSDNKDEKTFNLPDIDSVIPTSTPTKDESTTPISEKDDSYFALPDFDKADDPFSTGDTRQEIRDYLKDPIFDDPAFTAPKLEESKKTSGDDSSSNQMDFSGLYDKETMEGHSAQTEEPQGRGRGYLVLCALCALICLLSTLAWLFVIPSRFNLLKNSKQKPQEVAALVPQTPAPTVEVLPPPVVAEVDRVVVSPVPEIVPEKPPVNPKKMKDIIHIVKWGDTLWDLSQTYYRTPWKYKKIAEYNHIPNPDLILSGTKITIPAQ